MDTTTPPNRAPLAQLDRAPDYGSGGYRFESCGVYQFKEALETSAPALFASAPLSLEGLRVRRCDPLSGIYWSHSDRAPKKQLSIVCLR